MGEYILKRFIRFLIVLTVIASLTARFYAVDGVDTAGSLMAVVAEDKKEEFRIKPKNSVQQAAAEFDMSPKIGTENLSEGQLKINKIVSALRRLPDTELERLDVDIKSNDIILEGSESAAKLVSAWEQRQKELKEAMKDMLNAAQFMKSIATVLADEKISQTEKQASLRELEGLLCDIDNARDFHTIGGWPALAACLSSAYPVDTQALAAWAIGSAVKNSYDYQLWVIEPLNFTTDSNTNTTALHLLVDIVSTYEQQQEHGVENDLFQEGLKKAIYAISAAARGNIDVQNSLMDQMDGNGLAAGRSLFLNSLYNISMSTNRTHADVMRKIWSFVYDMLEERRYIREVLPVTVSNTDLAILSSLPILGDALMGDKWANLAVFVLFKSFQEFSALKDSKVTDKSRFIALHATIYNVLRCVHLYAEFAHTQSTDVTAAFKSPLESNESPKNFYEKVKPSLVNLLTGIDATLQQEEGDVCADILEEVRQILMLL